MAVVTNKCMISYDVTKLLTKTSFGETIRYTIYLLFEAKSDLKIIRKVLLV